MATKNDNKLIYMGNTLPEAYNPFRENQKRMFASINEALKGEKLTVNGKPLDRAEQLKLAFAKSKVNAAASPTTLLPDTGEISVLQIIQSLGQLVSFQRDFTPNTGSNPWALSAKKVLFSSSGSVSTWFDGVFNPIAEAGGQTKEDYIKAVNVGNILRMTAQEYFNPVSDVLQASPSMRVRAALNLILSAIDGLCYNGSKALGIDGVATFTGINTTDTTTSLAAMTYEQLEAAVSGVLASVQSRVGSLAPKDNVTSQMSSLFPTNLLVSPAIFSKMATLRHPQTGMTLLDVIKNSALFANPAAMDNVRSTPALATSVANKETMLALSLNETVMYHAYPMPAQFFGFMPQIDQSQAGLLLARTMGIVVAYPDAIQRGTITK